MSSWTPERQRELRRHRREAAARRKTDSPNGAPAPAETGAPGGGLSTPPQAATTPFPTTTTEDFPMSVTDNRNDPEIVYDLPRTKVVRLIEDLENAKQRQADANTAHMGEWKAAKEAGAPVEALKQCLKLNRMSSDKRSDFLRGFDELRRKVYSHWDEQPDLFVQPEEQAAAAQAEDDQAETEDRDDAEATGTTQVAERAAPSEPDPAQELPAGGEDKGETSATGAVAAFNDGRKAGRSGADVGINPHSARSAVGKSWRKGWEVGASDLVKIKEEGMAARRAGQGMEVAPYISDTDPAGAKAWAIGWYQADQAPSNVVTLPTAANPVVVTDEPATAAQ